MRLSKVVIPIEHSVESMRGQLLDTCKLLKLANRALAEVHFIYVLGDFDRDFHLQDRAVKQRLLAQIQLETEHALDQLIAAAKAEYADCDFRKAILKGVPFTAANKYAASINADLLVLNTQKLTGSSHSFNSFTKHLMRKSTMPIWAWSNRNGDRLNKIAAAIDIGPRDEVNHKLNCKILRSAAKMAETLNSSLCVVHAWRLYGESHLLHWEMKSPEEVAEIARQEISARQNAVQELVEAVIKSAPKTEVKVIEGNAAEALPAFVKDYAVDLLVMGTVCRTGIPGFFIGNTAESVLDRVQCDLLTLKPDEFRSPLI